MAIPAQGTLAVERRLKMIEVHVVQLEELLFFVENSQPGSPPICGTERHGAYCTALAFVPLRKQPIHIFRRGIDLRQAFLPAITLLRPPAAGLQT